jgi:hypothetical protein
MTSDAIVTRENDVRVTIGETVQTHEVSVEVSAAPAVEGRTVPLDQIVSAGDIAALLMEHRSELTFRDQDIEKITGSMVSRWSARHATNGFPRPLPIKTAAGLLWDRRDFIDPAGRLTWNGPPGRWYRRDVPDIEEDPARHGQT